MDRTEVHKGEPPSKPSAEGSSEEEELAGDPADKGEPPDPQSSPNLTHSMIPTVADLMALTSLVTVSSEEDDSEDTDCIAESGSEKWSEARIPSALLSAASKSWSTPPIRKEDSLQSMHRELECHEYVFTLCLKTLLDRTKNEKITHKHRKLTRSLLCKVSTHLADSIVEYAKVKFDSDFANVLCHPSSKPSVCQRINELLPRYLDDGCTSYFPSLVETGAKETMSDADGVSLPAPLKSGEKSAVPSRGTLFPSFPAGPRHFSPYTGAASATPSRGSPLISTAALLNSPEYVPGQGLHASAVIPRAPLFRLNPESPSIQPRMPEIKDRARVEKSKVVKNANRNSVGTRALNVGGLSLNGMGFAVGPKELSESRVSSSESDWSEQGTRMTESEVHSGLVKVCGFVVSKMLPKADSKSRAILSNIVADSIFGVCSAAEKPWILAPHNRLKLVSEIKLSCGENYYSDEYLTLSLESLGLKDE